MASISAATAARLDLAHDLVRRAGELLLGFPSEPVDIESEATKEYIAETRRSVSELIREAVIRHFPDDVILEDDGAGGASPQLWVIDPIDGVVNFVRGLPSYAISVAYIADGRVELGVVHVPLLHETFAALRGHGAYCNDRPVRVSECSTLSSARIAAEYDQRGSKTEHLRFLGRLLRAEAGIIKVSSPSVCLALTAAGRIDGYFERDVVSRDVLAGQLLVHEAGGWTNDLGAGGLLQRGFAIAAGPALVDPLRAIANI